MQSVAYTFLYIRCEALYYLNGENAWGSKLFDTPSYLSLKVPNKNCSRWHFKFLLLSFKKNKAWFFHVNPLLSRGFTWNIKSYFLWKTMKKYLWMSSTAVLIGAWRLKNSFHISVIINFPLEDEPGVAMIAWTTTPWTLPSNLSLCVNPTMDYVKVKGWYIDIWYKFIVLSFHSMRVFMPPP